MKRKKSKKMKVLGFICTIVGLALAGYGISELTKTNYAGGDVEVKSIPETRKTDYIEIV